MEREILTVTSNRSLGTGVFEMKLSGSSVCKAGQFVNLELEGLFLRRPISVCDWEDGTLTLAVKMVGKGTAMMAGMAPGTKIDVLTGLGKGFDTEVPCEAPLLVGGGIGNAPLYKLAKDLIAKGKKVTVVAGFRSSAELFYEEEFKALGVNLLIATEDGSKGTKGFVTDAIRESGVSYDYIYSCGPMPMMRALCKATTAPGQMSLEERMGCGFGICMGCTIQTTKGPRRVCKDGPVFNREEITW